MLTTDHLPQGCRSSYKTSDLLPVFHREALDDLTQTEPESQFVDALTTLQSGLALHPLQLRQISHHARQRIVPAIEQHM